NACPNSSPTAPAPTTSSERGSSVRSSAVTWSIQSTSSMPSTGGTAVRVAVSVPSALVDALGGRHGGARAGCDQDPVGLELLFLDEDCVRVHEHRLAPGGRADRSLDGRAPLRLAP